MQNNFSVKKALTLFLISFSTIFLNIANANMCRELILKKNYEQGLLFRTSLVDKELLNQYKPIEFPEKKLEPEEVSNIIFPVEQPYLYNGHVIYQKTTQNWETNYHAAPFAPLTDPRYAVHTLKQKASVVMGFFQISENQILVPRAALLNSKIRIINERLKQEGLELINVTYREVEANELVSSRTYLDGLIANAEMVLARTGDFAVHDTAHHLLTFLLPPKLVSYFQNRARLVRAFDKFLLEKGVRKQFDNWRHEVDKEASTYDVLSGGLPLITKNVLRYLNFAVMRFEVPFLKNAIQEGLSPYDNLKWRANTARVDQGLLNEFLVEYNQSLTAGERQLLQQDLVDYYAYKKDEATGSYNKDDFHSFIVGDLDKRAEQIVEVLEKIYDQEVQ